MRGETRGAGARRLGRRPTGSASNSIYMIDEHEVLVQLGKRKPAPRPVAELPPAGHRRGCRAEERKVAQAWGVAVGLNLPESDG